MLSLSSHFYLIYFLLSFFFSDTSTTEIYTLSLHDALPISIIFFDSTGSMPSMPMTMTFLPAARDTRRRLPNHQDRKSTRLNSSHLGISYAVFCLKKKKNK